MKMIKTMLLASAAVAVVSTGAQADELSALKAQIEALTARVAANEATASAIPAGYSLVSISKGQALKFGLDSDVDAPATVISVMPTADAPSGPTVTISGNVKAAIVHSSIHDGVRQGAGPDLIFGTADDVVLPNSSDKSLDVDSSAGITIAGVTDTAVGEVGAKASFAFGWNESTDGSMTLGPDGYWGYWAFADGMKLGGGRDGSLANVGYGIGECSCNFTGAGETGQGGAGDPSQMRLSYGSGPLSFAVAIEDATRDNAGIFQAGDDDAIGFAAEAKYSMDMLSFEVAGGVWGEDDLNGSANKKNQFGAGLGLTFDPITLHIAASSAKHHNGQRDTDVSFLAKASLADGISAEMGYGIARMNPTGANNTKKQSAIIGGIYYSPVSQLVIGLEGSYVKDNDNLTFATQHDDGATVAFMTKYSF